MGYATLQGWQRLLIPYRLLQGHYHLAAPEKNATDIGLVIDVFESTYQYGVRKFCLAVTDSDYTSLVFHQRSIGCTVLVLGMMQTVSALKEACYRFVALDQSAIPIAPSEEREEGQVAASVMGKEEEPVLQMKIEELCHLHLIWAMLVAPLGNSSVSALLRPHC